MNVGVVTWNVHGDDKNSSTGAARCNELNGIMQQIHNAGKSINVICLQETCGTDGALYDWLSNQGYLCSVIQEEKDAGKYLLFGVYQQWGGVPNGPYRILIDYQEPASGPTRYPAAISIDFLLFPTIEIINLHASLGSRLIENIQKLSDKAEAQVAKNGHLNIVAGDLNITASYVVADDDGQEVPLLEQVFPSFIGGSHHLDHIFAAMKDQTVTVTDALHYGTSSDHDLVYVNFTIPD